VNTMKNVSAVLALALAATLLGACAALEPEPTLTESHFGDSVRQMIEAQTYDPSTLSSPSTQPVEGGDGQRIENVLEAYRQDVAKPATADDDIVINLGDGQRR
jgi:hypothetical protein